MLVGAFLIVVLFAISISRNLFDRQKMYYAYFEGESVTGLEKGADVKYHGVKIGKVDIITWDSDDLTRVRVEIRVEEDFPMKEDMYITTGVMGITMLKYIEILGGTNEAELLPPNSEMPVRPSMISTITGKADVIVGKIELLLNHLTAITHPESLSAVKEILDNVSVISADARNFFDIVRPDIQNMTHSIKSVIEKVDSIATDIASLSTSLNTALGGSQVPDIITSIDSTAYALKSVTRDFELLIKQSREDIVVSMENLREALENANELTKILAENPSLLLRSEQQRQREIR
jgi:phospholipid/cholesterol/gamma-HCH transport system substrate-binding protein